jgi:choline kinase/DNA-binding winged helix-turn-helix (wHTH) protein
MFTLDADNDVSGSLAAIGVSRSRVEARFRFARFELDVRARELRKDGIRFRLQEQPFIVLHTLLQQPGEVVTREELYRCVWPEGTYVDWEHGLNAAVKRLRAALGDTVAAPRFIETISRRGYRFIAPVEASSPLGWGLRASGVPDVPVRTALVLAAGNGDRFRTERRQSKLLEPILGQPLILRTLQTARDAGITRAELVLGYQADSLRRVIERHAPDGLDVHFSYNAEWHLENGVSVLTARERLHVSRFALLMGDHLFHAPMLTRLLREPIEAGESALAIDSRPAPPAVAEEATKVRLSGSRIVAIGKDLAVYDALDTGVFVCAPTLFDALVESREADDTTLSGGIRRLAARGLMLGVDVGDVVWHDIDTRADLAAAAAFLRAEPQPA